MSGFGVDVWVLLGNERKKEKKKKKKKKIHTLHSLSTTTSNTHVLPPKETTNKFVLIFGQSKIRHKHLLE